MKNKKKYFNSVKMQFLATILTKIKVKDFNKNKSKKINKIFM